MAPDASTGTFTVVLGVAQDGGLPHIGCEEDRCRTARRYPELRRRVASIGIVAQDRFFLVDATPDLADQAAELARAAGRSPKPRRPVDGVFLTHAHIGHYLGLLQLGREAAGARGVAVWGTPRMGSFLRANAPFDQLLRLGNISFREIGSRVELPGGVSVEAIPVPHREEYTDTVGYVVRGPSRAVLWLPDIDSWEAWDRELEEVLAGVDRAYVDGTFFADGELEGRDMSRIPHPRVSRTVDMLGDLPRGERGKVRFIHLNHTNPLWDQGSEARRRVEQTGMGVAERGERTPL